MYYNFDQKSYEWPTTFRPGDTAVTHFDHILFE